MIIKIQNAIIKNKVFLISFAFFLLIYSFIFEAFTFDGAMFAEAATNYYFKAQTNDGVLGFFTILFSIDYGYYNFINRIITLFAKYLYLTPIETAYFYNWSTGILVAFTFAFFLLPQFDFLINSKLCRFIISCTIFLICMSNHYDNGVFINFGNHYIFILLISYALFFIIPQDQKISNIFWFIPLLLASKPLILSFTPILLISFLYTRHKKIQLISALAIGIVIMQLVRLLESHLERSGDYSATDQWEITDKILYFMETLSSYIGYHVFPFFSKISYLNVVLGFIVCLLMVIYSCKTLLKFRKLFKNKKFNIPTLTTKESSDHGAGLRAKDLVQYSNLKIDLLISLGFITLVTTFLLISSIGIGLFNRPNDLEISNQFKEWIVNRNTTVMNICFLISLIAIIFKYFRYISELTFQYTYQRSIALIILLGFTSFIVISATQQLNLISSKFAIPYKWNLPNYMNAVNFSLWTELGNDHFEQQSEYYIPIMPFFIKRDWNQQWAYARNLKPLPKVIKANGNILLKEDQQMKSTYTS